MSRQLSRIRHLISDIEQIQKNGQKPHVSPALSPLETKPVDDAQTETPTESVESISTPPAEGEEARVALALSGNVIVEMLIPDSEESLEIRQVYAEKKSFLEIRFSDGKAVHLPLKNVA